LEAKKESDLPDFTNYSYIVIAEQILNYLKQKPYFGDVKISKGVKTLEKFEKATLLEIENTGIIFGGYIVSDEPAGPDYYIDITVDIGEEVALEPSIDAELNLGHNSTHLLRVLYYNPNTYKFVVEVGKDIYFERLFKLAVDNMTIGSFQVSWVIYYALP